MLRQHGCRLMIHGHTHRPAIHDFTLDGHAARRIVLGTGSSRVGAGVLPAGQRLDTRALG
jgi:UDP-2,3-diacylglucosamine hydrolase